MGEKSLNSTPDHLRSLLGHLLNTLNLRDKLRRLEPTPLESDFLGLIANPLKIADGVHRTDHFPQINGGRLTQRNNSITERVELNVEFIEGTLLRQDLRNQAQIMLDHRPDRPPKLRFRKTGHGHHPFAQTRHVGIKGFGNMFVLIHSGPLPLDTRAPRNTGSLCQSSWHEATTRLIHRRLTRQLPARPPTTGAYAATPGARSALVTHTDKPTGAYGQDFSDNTRFLYGEQYCWFFNTIWPRISPPEPHRAAPCAPEASATIPANKPPGALRYRGIVLRWRQHRLKIAILGHRLTLRKAEQRNVFMAVRATLRANRHRPTGRSLGTEFVRPDADRSPRIRT